MTNRECLNAIANSTSLSSDLTEFASDPACQVGQGCEVRGQDSEEGQGQGLFHCHD